MIDETVGPYRVLAKLGEGGMGEVYRASDTRLKREVALKVLPEAFALDRDRLARFEREAQVVAALNHPNIAALYGLEDLRGRPALVLELVEGPTLADRMAQGPIPQDETVAIARQIADALEAAHELGIVHRDLKPANIKLRPDGMVKVLDFGLAKLMEGPAGRLRPGSGQEAGHYGGGERGVGLQPDTLSPTITSPAMTAAGVILGTAAYMSPEQAAARPADKRADIWSFGVVLWEMLTGGRLFAGESTSYVLADVLRSPIDFSRVPAGPLRELLQRCLDRDVKTRLRDIAEARVALTRPLAPAVAPPSGVMSRRAHLAWAASVVVLSIAVGVALWAPWRIELERPLMMLPFDLGADVALPESAATNVVLSPDETRLLYVASVAGGTTRIYIRRLDDATAVELPGTEGATGAAFSPDSKSVVFLVGKVVDRTSAEGGAALRLAETDLEGIAPSLTWGDNDTIVVGGLGPLQLIPPNGGKPVKLTEVARPAAAHAAAHILPGARTMLFAADVGGSRIEGLSLAGGQPKVIVPDAYSPHYLQTGHLLYLRQNTLFAVRFDPDTLETHGDAVPIVKGVKTFFIGGVSVGTFSVSDKGTLVYRSGPAIPGLPPFRRQSTFEWIDMTGQRLPLVPNVGACGDPRLAPGGGQLALTCFFGSSRANPGGPDIAVYDPRRDSVPRKLSFDGVSVNPVWKPDSRYIVFLNFADQKLGGELRWTRDTGGSSQRLVEAGGVGMTGSFSPDGKRLAYVALADPMKADFRSRRPNIYTVTVTEEGGQLKAGAPERFSPPQFNEFEPEFSPDGRWIAFISDRTGQNEVWVRSASSAKNGQTFEVQVSSNGGAAARWFSDNQLLYQSGQGGDRIMSVRYRIQGDMLLLERASVRAEIVRGDQWDVARDGRIAVATLLEGPQASRAEHTVVFLQNFADEVRRRVK